jgi:hypothetical protein
VGTDGSRRTSKCFQCFLGQWSAAPDPVSDKCHPHSSTPHLNTSAGNIPITSRQSPACQWQDQERGDPAHCDDAQLKLCSFVRLYTYEFSTRSTAKHWIPCFPCVCPIPHYSQPLDVVLEERPRKGLFLVLKFLNNLLQYGLPRDSSNPL